MGDLPPTIAEIPRRATVKSETETSMGGNHVVSARESLAGRRMKQRDLTKAESAGVFGADHACYLCNGNISPKTPSVFQYGDLLVNRASD
jgi:hypothetical protein